MIPNSNDLIKQISPKHVQFLLLNGHDYFYLADQYVTLQRIFVKENIYETYMIWFDMLVSPLLTIIYSIWKQSLPSFLTILSFQKCVNLWKQWLQFQELKVQVREWMNIVRSIGGPFISSNDPDYHMFVYADGMQRLHHGLTALISEKRAKCTQ